MNMKNFSSLQFTTDRLPGLDLLEAYSDCVAALEALAD